MKEGWVNVYKYPKLNNYCYSSLIADKKDAIRYSSLQYAKIVGVGPRQTVYRIHVKLKEPNKPKWDGEYLGVKFRTIDHLTQV